MAETAHQVHRSALIWREACSHDGQRTGDAADKASDNAEVSSISERSPERLKDEPEPETYPIICYLVPSRVLKM